MGLYQHLNSLKGKSLYNFFYIFGKDKSEMIKLRFLLLSDLSASSRGAVEGALGAQPPC